MPKKANLAPGDAENIDLETVIFLDIDGVLNTWESATDEDMTYRKASDGELCFYHNLHDPSVANLNKITDTTGASLVISSTWRIGTEGQFEDLILYLQEQGVTAPVVGRTPSLPSVDLPPYSPYGRMKRSEAQRGTEIQAWMDERKEVTWNFIILDDESDMAHLLHKLVRTDGMASEGLREDHVVRALKLLGGQDED